MRRVALLPFDVWAVLTLRRQRLVAPRSERRCASKPGRRPLAPAADAPRPGTKRHSGKESLPDECKRWPRPCQTTSKLGNRIRRCSNRERFGFIGSRSTTSGFVAVVSRIYATSQIPSTGPQSRAPHPRCGSAQAQEAVHARPGKVEVRRFGGRRRTEIGKSQPLSRSERRP